MKPQDLYELATAAKEEQYRVLVENTYYEMEKLARHGLMKMTVSTYYQPHMERLVALLKADGFTITDYVLNRDMSKCIVKWG